MEDSVLQNIRREAYKEYIDNHRANVKYAYAQLCDKINALDEKNFAVSSDSKILDKLESRINNHDMSKYSDEEFEPYRVRFNPINDEEYDSEAEKNYDKAWKHHYENNDHHWEHWIGEDGQAIKMPEIAVLELICDWMAMSMKYGGTPKEYYENNKEKEGIRFHPQTKEYFERLLDLLF